MKAQLDKNNKKTVTGPSLIHRCGFSEAVSSQQSIDFSVMGSGNLMALSDLLPMIENLGVDVLTSESQAEDKTWQVRLTLRPQAQQLLLSEQMQLSFLKPC